jgi:branched-chain amino acid aminotransferase
MLAFVNGTVLPEEEATVSISDRAFRYGDGLFEAVLIANGTPFRWDSHVARLATSARALQMPMAHPSAALRDAAKQLVRSNNLADAILRIQISRGEGPRGYAPTGTERPVTLMTVHPAPDRISPPHWNLTVSSLRVAADNSLGHHKSCSRLLQVMAAIEARDRNADESLLLDTDGHITEGGSSNLFWIERGIVCTPPSNACGLSGVTRAVVLECCRKLGVATDERNIRPERLCQAEGVFLTLTSRGVVEATMFDGAKLSSSPLTARLQQAVENLIQAECR